MEYAIQYNTIQQNRIRLLAMAQILQNEIILKLSKRPSINYDTFFRPF